MTSPTLMPMPGADAVQHGVNELANLGIRTRADHDDPGDYWRLSWRPHWC